jgi:outer membrane protein
LVAAVLVAAAHVGAQDATPMSLPEAIAWAVNHNPRLAAAAARIEQAEARVSAAKAPAQPAFKLTGSGRLQEPVQQITIPVLPNRTISLTRTDYATVALGVVWPLWTGGRVEAATGAARAQVGVAEADLQQATEQLLYEVGLDYFRALSSRRALAEAQAGLARAGEDLRTARAQHAAGVLTVAELSQAEAAQRRAQQLVAAAENAVTDADQAFNTVLARPVDEPVLLADVPLELALPSEADAQEVALATRPELLALSDRREAAQQAIAQARAERNPSIAAVGQAAWQTPTEVQPSHNESFGIEFSWPILNHPASRANERQARVTVREIDDLRSDLESAITLQVGQSARRLADATEALSASDEALRSAEEGARTAQVAYESGTATRQQVTAAQTARDQAREERAQAECALSAAKLGRARALGLLRALLLVPAEEASP